MSLEDVLNQLTSNRYVTSANALMHLSFILSVPMQNKLIESGLLSATEKDVCHVFRIKNIK